MKHLKILGLAAIAAMACMAFVGATSASATVLCKTKTEGGACPEHYPAGTKLTATTSLATLTSGTEPVECESEVSSKATTGGATETVKNEGTELETLSFTKCNHTVDVLKNGKGSLELHWTSGDNGTVTSKNASITVSIFGISCVYGTPAGGKTIGTATGGASATIDISVKVEKKEGGFLCPSEPVWEGTYTVTSPSPLYVEPS